ncbi:hypothetical protein D0T49_03655 [Paludibacter sp. 221]|uniref:hypothetical protein n=1 Tax=Paludibacter sp. 221 TaxID=2302939 RepID=UPI0013D2F126|nr:hypothetical protein [Paludibacter sp. 221]NDV46136.1 hypothetical protein [Paludibacter sp. 221]
MDKKERLKPVKKIDVKATLLQMQPGDFLDFKYRDVVLGTLKSAVSRLNKNPKTGKMFTCSEKEIEDGVRVYCTKIRNI